MKVQQELANQNQKCVIIDEFYNDEGKYWKDITNIVTRGTLVDVDQ